MTEYVEGGLAEFAPPPYIFNNLISATFFLDADKDKIDGICDKFLNRPLNRAAGQEFEPASDKVALTCSTFPMSEAPSAPIGYTHYCEIALMFSVYDRKHDQWSWFAPVLYLDGPAAGDAEWQPALPIAIGRELYGLAKRRAEILMDTTDYTGTLSTIGFASPGSPVNVRDVLRIGLASEIEAMQLGRRIADSERRLITSGFHDCPEPEAAAVNPFEIRGDASTEKLRKDRKAARSRFSEEKVEARRLAAMPCEKRQSVSPGDLMTKIWGKDPYARVASRTKAKAPTGEKLLQKLGLPNKAVTKRAYQSEIDFYLLGLRQLRDPQNFSRAEVQQVVRTQMSFDRLPWPVIRDYYIDINEQSDFSRVLGLRSQRLDATDVFEYRRATARFGDTVSIVT